MTKATRPRDWTSLKSVFQSVQGAIDLGSIIVGVIVIGVLSGVIAASVFAVIPWAQNKAAQANLETVSLAEGVTRVTNDGSFKYDSHKDSIHREAETADIGLRRPSQRLIVDNSSCSLSWIAVHRSASGTIFVRTGGDLTACGEPGPTGTGDVNKAYPVSSTGPNAGVIPSVIIQNLPGGIADTTPAAMVKAVIDNVPYAFGGPAVVPVPTPLPVYAGETIFGWSSNTTASMVADETSLGVRNGMVSVYTDFASLSAFPAADAVSAAEREAALLVAWEPWDSNVNSTTQSTYKPTAITAGNFDPYITNWLSTAQTHAVAGTVMVRFAPEMNDSARPWSGGENGGNTPADYIAMWRHVHAIKQAVAPDVILVWNPFNYGASPYSMTQMYPGAAYVDMLAIDGFNWSDTRNPGVCNWQSYDDVLKAPIAELKALAADGSKPWGIAEVASAPDKPADFQTGGSCYGSWSWALTSPSNPPFEETPADWITQEGWTDMLFKKARADGALFVNLFHINKETDWRIGDTAAGQAVVAELVATPGWVAGDGNSAGYIKAAQ